MQRHEVVEQLDRIERNVLLCEFVSQLEEWNELYWETREEFFRYPDLHERFEEVEWVINDAAERLEGTM